MIVCRRAQRPKLRIPALALAIVVFLAPSIAHAQKAGENITMSASRTPTLQVDPLLIAEAAEVWKLIASPENPIWPGWDASATPLLFYLPGKQDVLVNHPRPPEGFVPYEGPIEFPGGRIFVKDGATLIEWDGQNTSKDVAGVRTLVVADTLSNLRSRISGLMQGARATAETSESLNYADLATDPYHQLALVAHEAFHVFQQTKAPGKGANEMLLLNYPVLSVENNVGFAQEGAALAEALRAADDTAFRRAVVRWLALRQDRRARLPEEAVEYEDGAENSEGLAKYTEYRLFQVLEGRRPGAAMSWAQGFGGYLGLAPQRERLLESMVEHMSGTVVVNNDPYGTAPLRMRLYYSGMAIGVMLDRLAPAWKSRIFSPGVSLISLVEEALEPSKAEVQHALLAARSEADYSALVETKKKLAQEGRARTESVLEQIEHGPGTGLVIDYSKLTSPRLSMAFTPFGITRVDEERTIFSQVPIAIAFGQNGEMKQTVAMPLLRDTERRLVRFRLPPDATAAEVEKAVGSSTATGRRVDDLALDLPGVALKAPKAELDWNGKELIIVLLENDRPK